MYYVYVLMEMQSHRRYIGFSADLKQRMEHHRAGCGCKTTQSGDWRLVYYEAFSSKTDALKRERKLKHHGMAKRKLFERICNSLADQNKAGNG